MSGKFAEYCKKNSDEIYQKLNEYIPRRAPEEFYKMVREYTDRRGKYARPNLALLWSELYGAPSKNVFPFACGIQMCEDWILMHDDWMDNNELRRGKPTAHKMFGNENAILAGDTGHMLMWKIVHDGSGTPNAEIGKKLFDKFFDIILVTVEGQYYDFSLTKRKTITDFTLEDYWQSIHAKSAYYSVYGPMQLGTIAAGQADQVVKGIRDYGTPVGNAFQIKDDILDCTSTAEVLGKTIGNDVMEGVKTAILHHFVQHARPSDLEFAKHLYAKERSQKMPDEVERMLGLFKDNGSITYAENLADQLAKEALEKFENHTKNIPESDTKETARNAIVAMTVRKK
ncbi:MAG TPA: polyprenyl synthetase family protein [Candidatus Norongarragalinales archaeon]|jgi:geranylgeranyl pyrophosphate synthase|nr:polyprenyl synthetase family protein [Candidatus Norongarragalinales archaeon]